MGRKIWLVDLIYSLRIVSCPGHLPFFKFLMQHLISSWVIFELRVSLVGTSGNVSKLGDSLSSGGGWFRSLK